MSVFDLDVQPACPPTGFGSYKKINIVQLLTAANIDPFGGRCHVVLPGFIL